ncbi:MAG TPA: 3-oxoacyl-ACP synthase, partial [Ruminococcaceae bacterium]|nr:3-oxoacyl-ACP synthase [Oscillospiraceae bacterium]
MSFKIIGTGSAHPVCSKTNGDLAKMMDTSDEWIYSRTGIKSRYVCTDETITDIAVEAAQSALKNAGIEPSELDGIICTTIRGDYFTPSLSCCVQERIGASCPAFDMNAACSGFLYALDTADGFFARKRVKKMLIVSCENMSKLLDWHDRTTCCVFG